MGKSSRGSETRSSVGAAGFVRAAVVGVAVVIGLSGCSMLGVGDAEPSHTATASPSPAATAVASDVTFTAPPDVTGMPSCSAVLPAGLTARLVSAIADDDPVRKQRHLDAAELVPVAAGGLSCQVDNGVAVVDTVDPHAQGPIRNAITASVVPDASAALDRYLAWDGPTGRVPGAPVWCNASDAARVECHADVHAGSAWLVVNLDRVQDADDVTPENLQDRFQALVTSAASVVQDSALGTREVPHGDDDERATICSATNVNAVTAAPLVVRSLSPEYIPDQLAIATSRADLDWCGFGLPSENGADTSAPARYAMVPGGSWIVEARIDAGLIDADDRLDLDGLGTGDAAFRTCDDTLCTVDVVHGGDWTRYLLQTSVAPDTSAAIETWARSSFGH